MFSMGRQGKSWKGKPGRCHYSLWDPGKETKDTTEAWQGLDIIPPWLLTFNLY